MAWLWYALLLCVMVAGFLLNTVTFPGNWLMVGGAAAYAALTHGQFISLSMLLFLLVLATVAEVTELLAMRHGAQRAGASKRGKWGAFLGGILGGIILSFFLPIVGTVVGIIVGSFVGAVVAELSGGEQTSRALRVGTGAAVGRLMGMFAKMVFGMVIFVLGLYAAFPYHRAHSAIAAKLPVTTNRSTAPTTR